ncbi:MULTISPECIES: VOC family protein [unclassified Sphingomonas]|uniref:VOC family protein n=1 Tax=unclassified Sphingomonas TaxID=196159 RepID=UPI00215086E4|nr:MULTISPECIES: VOC family protein [unclassified Sphingomonas]MCR5871155.1 lactoylglutathione lyase [Sphingomonas sp. J344]UUY00534.1 lactoylglutathione lyase [Sphingomonas sp. J315]
MAKMIFVNLPVRDVAASTAFYEAIGFTRDPRFSNEMASAMQWSDEITLMILGHDFYSTFIPHKTIADSSKVNEVLLCLSFDSREAVDAITEKAGASGGKADVREPQDMGFMYGRSFEDPDGHIFEPMFMDMEAAMAAFPDGPAHEPA